MSDCVYNICDDLLKLKKRREEGMRVERYTVEEDDGGSKLVEMPHEAIVMSCFQPSKRMVSK